MRHAWVTDVANDTVYVGGRTEQGQGTDTERDKRRRKERENPRKNKGTNGERT